MSSNPEASVPVTKAAYLGVNLSLEAACLTMWEQSKGRRQTYYEEIYGELPASLRDTVRQLVTRAYPSPPAVDINPRALAIEQGMVIGTRFARLTMTDNTYERYCKRLQADLARLGTYYNGGGTSPLADFVSATGSLPGRDLLRHLPPDVRVFPPNNSSETMRNNTLYGDAIGYTAAMAKTMLLELEIKQCQPTDADAREEIGAQIGQLAALSEAALAGYFPVPD